MQKKQVQTKQGNSISYMEMGQGRPIVLLHGFVGSHKYWDLVIETLAKQYRVIAPDLPGHGASSSSTNLHSIADYADEIADLLIQLELEKITLFGHSLGGFITLAYAEKYASNLESFALFHSTALPDADGAKANRLIGIEKIRTKGIDAFVDEAVPLMFAPTNLERHEQVTKEIGYSTSVSGAISALQAMIARPNRIEVLERAEVPVLLLTGSEDVVAPPARAFITAENKNIKQVLLPNVGHMSMYEAPQLLVEEIKQFLDGQQ